MKANKKAIISILLIAVCAIVLFFVYRQFVPSGQTGQKNVTVVVVHGDKTTNNFTCQTDKAFLGEVLDEYKLVDGTEGEYGLFITTADDETADDSKEEWWCLTKGGAQVNTSADQTPVEDGDVFELTLTTGY